MRSASGREAHGEARSERGLREILRDQGLAETAAALEQYGFAAVDEVELDEAVDERAIDLLGVGPVEAVEGFEGSEAREPGAAGEIDRDAGALLEIGELLEGLSRAKAALVDVREEGGERVAPL